MELFLRHHKREKVIDMFRATKHHCRFMGMLLACLQRIAELTAFLNSVIIPKTVVEGGCESEDEREVEAMLSKSGDGGESGDESDDEREVEALLVL